MHAISAQARRWWFGLGVILIPAAILRFTGFTFGLPYFDQMDEPWNFYEAAHQRGLLSYWLYTNPSPGLNNILKVGQVIAEALTHDPATAHVTEIITVMRFISVIASLITLVFIGLCARELAGDKAGWLAAATWALIPFVIYHSFIAIAEPWMMLFGALALYTAVATMRRKSIGWPILSVCAGLAAFAFKYSMFPFAGIGLAAVLWRFWRERDQRRKWIKAIALQVICIVAFLGFLALFAGLLQDVTNPGREVAVFLKSPLARLTDRKLIGQIISVGFTQFGTTPLIFAALYAGALWILAHTGKVASAAPLTIWLLFGALGLFTMLLIPLYLLTDATLERYLFAADLIFIILAAGSAAVIFDYLRTLLHTLPSARKWHTLLAPALVILSIVWLGPLAAQSAQEAYARTKIYTVTDMTVWASYSLDDGGMLAEGLGSRAFNLEFGGYTGLKRTVTTGIELLSKSPEAWRQDGYQYVELVQDYEQKLKATPEGSAYLGQMLELRRFPPAGAQDAYTGPAFVVYALNRPQIPLDIAFGDTFKLIGCDGMRTSAAPGDRLAMRFYWQTPRTPGSSYALFVHLDPLNSDQLIAQVDGAPGPVNRPTQTWNVPDETLVSGTFTLTIPENLPSGPYRLFIGLYDRTTGQRLPTAQGDRALLETLTIAPDF